MRRNFRTITLAIALIALPPIARAAQLGQVQKKLDAANLAAARHQAASAAAARQAAAAKRQADALVAKEVAVNAVLRTDEDRAARIAHRLARLGAKTKAAKAELNADAAAIAPLLPLIARLALHPAATLLAADAAPGRAAEGALVMRGLTREIGLRAQALRAARRRYASLSAALAAEQTKMSAAVATQSQRAAALQADIIAVRHAAAAAVARHAAEARAAASAAQTAHNLLGVIARLQAERRQAARAREAAARIPVPQSLRGAPVAGKLVRQFGASTTAGPAIGDTFAAAPGAVVSASCPGRVVFARPFQNYGKLMILDCGGGYDFVMAGLARFDVRVGQSVVPGQPVGAMAGYDAHNPGGQPELYVELRHDGTAVDPTPRFGAAAASR
ncbi:peptidoglycan DD-metalloendopeptidase family protein [Acidiphilium sp. AL]|uniref:Peptidoglycan DD-metalloendopeptidase family protein n=1 Tax=Acidiphilium iwatense TaxID=768198 RepID=A0ABS9E368_9PROT|nr:MULTISPECIES: peptidoglycan DD-metalloendopeptidase family protein [Acidiphilium]MCF3948371.1 peptidoglycan DD-metalloendopeptidase family protein [Acidiphilium iwatense]MCU4161354.1 peptidoglycan DD-metalloendopeptidase family protein [Acidiphilium sp. AL]